MNSEQPTYDPRPWYSLEEANAYRDGYDDATEARPTAVEPEARPKIVCICGSTRFASSMNTEAERLTLAGAIVVRPEVVAYNRDRDQQFVEPEVKAALDVLHFRKIDLADEVVVVTVDHYIGESTTREIAYARQTGKPVTFHEYENGLAVEPDGLPLDVERLAVALHFMVCGDPMKIGHGARQHREDARIVAAEYARLTPTPAPPEAPTDG